MAEEEKKKYNLRIIIGDGKEGVVEITDKEVKRLIRYSMTCCSSNEVRALEDCILWDMIHNEKRKVVDKAKVRH